MFWRSNLKLNIKRQEIPKNTNNSYFLKWLSSRCSKNEKYIKVNGKYWSSYVQWRNLLLLTP